MTMKLVLTVSSGLLAAWMGASFVSSSGLVPMAGLVVAPQHSDSHRLGAIGNDDVDLPNWSEGESAGVSPFIGALVSVD